MQTLLTQWLSEHCYIILIPWYCKFTVKNWLHNSEDMKLVVPTHFVCFTHTQHTYAHTHIYTDIYIYITKQERFIPDSPWKQHTHIQKWQTYFMLEPTS